MTRIAHNSSRASLAFRLAFAFVALMLAPRAMHAQAADQIYAGLDLDTPPKLSNAAATMRLISDAYPDQLKRAGVRGTVQIQFIVGINGKVEPGSIEIIAASLPALGAAARDIAAQIEFKPGTAKGQPVRSRVLLPILFKSQ